MTLAARLSRDAPTEGGTPTSNLNLEDAVNQVTELLKKTFSQESIQKYSKNLQELSDQLTSKGQELFAEAGNAIKNMQEQKPAA